MQSPREIYKIAEVLPDSVVPIEHQRCPDCQGSGSGGKMKSEQATGFAAPQETARPRLPSTGPRREGNVMTETQKYPLHEMMSECSEERNTVQNVIDWLDEQGWTICELFKGHADDRYAPVAHSKEQIIARYFGVDLQAFDDEKRAMLDEFRAASESRLAKASAQDGNGG